MRTFISIDLPIEVIREVEKIQKSLPEFTGKKTELENLHLTLKFLSEVDEKEIEKIRSKLREINFNKFNCSIDSIGIFSKNFIKIVWLHLDNCSHLQIVIDSKLEEIGFQKQKRFMSHLTVARVKKVKDRDKFVSELSKIKIPDLFFEVDSFKLKKSMLTPDGPIYEVIEEYGLK